MPLIKGIWNRIIWLLMLVYIFSSNRVLICLNVLEPLIDLKPIEQIYHMDKLL